MLYAVSCVSSSVGTLIEPCTVQPLAPITLVPTDHNDALAGSADRTLKYWTVLRLWSDVYSVSDVAALEFEKTTLVPLMTLVAISPLHFKISRALRAAVISISSR